MNIEKLREEAAILGATGNALFSCHKGAFEEGAKWEYDRPKWVNVEDGLPEHDARVLVKYDSEEYIGVYDVSGQLWTIYNAGIGAGDLQATPDCWTEIPK